VARANYVPQLTIDRFAKIMGINPISFSGAVLSAIDTPLIPPGDACMDIWFQHAWQNKDAVSRDDLAYNMFVSEEEIANYLGYYFTPKWVVGENIFFDHHYMDYIFGVTGVDSGGRSQKLRLKYAWGTDIGIKKLTLISTEIPAYSSPDGDTFDELATLTVDITGLASFRKRDVKIFYHGETDDTYEIKYPKYISIIGSTMTIKLDSWLLLDPDLAEQYPNSNGEKAVDITANNKFVASVDVYIEGVDNSQSAVKFHWITGGVDYYQDGWGQLDGMDKSFVKVYPAIYDSGVWVPTSYDYVSTPAEVIINYRAGRMSREYYNDKSSDPLMDELAQIIIWLTIPRLEREFCQCGNLTSLSRDLREDYSLNKSFQDLSALSNPFGTRLGEIKAWKQLSRLERRNKSTGGCAV